MDEVKATTPSIENAILLFVARGDYKTVFLLAYGPFPHPCCFCNETVTGDAPPRSSFGAAIHHVDGDDSNHLPENLAPAHNRCHAQHHLTGTKASPETRAKLSAERKRRWANPEYKARVRTSIRNSVDRRTETRKTSIPIYRCEYCYKTITGGKGNVAQHERTCEGNPDRSPIQFSDEARERMSASHVGLRPSNETRLLLKKIYADRPIVACRYCGRGIKGPGPLAIHEKVCPKRT